MRIQSLENSLPAELYGGKAAHLSKMMLGGFPIPFGWAISSEVFEQRSNEEYLKEVRNELSALVQQHRDVSFMVRSSAIGEDGEGHSFAGQLSSFISGKDMDSIWRDILRCWDSYDKANVSAYSDQRAFSLKGMGVVIQSLIDPDYAGVSFSRSHLEPEAVLVEYVHGHGEQLVSGDVNPSRFHFRKDSLTLEGDDFSYAHQVVQSALAIEQFYGYPVDVEWAIRNGTYYVVQSRPITTAIASRMIYWSNTNVNENYPDPLSPLLYSIARNAYYFYFKNLAGLFQVPSHEIQSLESAFSNIIGVFGGKMYYNMTSIHTVLSSSPFAGLLIQSFDHFVGYDDGKKAKEQSSTWKQKKSFLKAFIRRNRLLEQDVLTFEKRAMRFHEQVNSAIVLHDFQKSFHDFIEIRMHSWYHASLADFFAMSFHGFLGKFCQLHYGDQGTGIQNQLIQAIPNLISSQPVLSMHQLVLEIRSNTALSEIFQEASPTVIWERVSRESEWQSFYNRIELYLENWGYRCSGELMLTHLNYIEDPAALMALLKQMHALPDYDPAKKMQEKHKEAVAVRSQFKRKILKEYWYRPGRLFIHLFLLRYLIDQACKGISSRERVRLKQAQLYFGLKKSLQSIGREWKKKGFLDSEMDILYFTYQELAEHLSASSLLGSDVKSMVVERKKLWDEQVKNQYPDDFYTREGRYASVTEVVSKENQQKDGQLSGLCACGGLVTGRVKVLENVLEASKLEQGDILVTRQTDPGWVTVFPLISGLIVERGGMLSHGAIVSREFGIPAIVGVHEATLRLKDGDQITLNANMGVIIIHD